MDARNPKRIGYARAFSASRVTPFVAQVSDMFRSSHAHPLQAAVESARHRASRQSTYAHGYRISIRRRAAVSITGRTLLYVFRAKRCCIASIGLWRGLLIARWGGSGGVIWCMLKSVSLCDL